MRIPILSDILPRLNTNFNEDQESDDSSDSPSALSTSTLISPLPSTNTSSDPVLSSTLNAPTAVLQNEVAALSLQPDSTQFKDMTGSADAPVATKPSPVKNVAIPNECPQVQVTGDSEESIGSVEGAAAGGKESKGLVPQPVGQSILQSGTSTPLVQSTMINTVQTAGRDINMYNVGGNLTINNVMRDTLTLVRLKELLNPLNAAYDSYETDQRSKCFENTRVQLLNNIKNWVTDSHSHAPIYVLDGVAGIGKSTVAQTVAEWAAECGILGASFFFTQADIQRTTAKHFFPTVAFQLSRQLEWFRQGVEKILEQDPDAPNKVIIQQHALLILKPLEHASSQMDVNRPILIIIDALDECNQEEAQTLLVLLAQSIHRFEMYHFKFFISSRPEWHIRSILEDDRNHQMFHLHEIDDVVVQSDIRLYLKFSLSPEQTQKVFSHRQPPWKPSSREMDMLCGVCGTLFIIASTATKFILDNKGGSPEKRLARLLDGVSPSDFSGSRKTDVMDKFYLKIIIAAAPEDSEDFEDWVTHYQMVLGALLVLQTPLPCAIIASLLQIEPYSIEETLLHLHSLVAPVGEDTIFQVHHKSFPDFITNSTRIQAAVAKNKMDDPTLTLKFLIHPPHHHDHLARACFRVMHEALKANIANLTPAEWHLDKSKLPELKQPVFTKELSYAVTHWASHLHAAIHLNNLTNELQQDLVHWLKYQILQWLEITSWLNQIGHANEILQMAYDTVCACTSDWSDKELARGILSDASRLVLQNGRVMRLSPMHVYWSAFPFLPRESAMGKLCRDIVGLEVKAGISQTWDSTLATMHGHSHVILAVAFSPNGSTLASGSADHTARLWSGKTGYHIATLRGHSNFVTAVAFSPDGSKLASGSKDTTVRLWDAQTGHHITTLNGHSDLVKAITFLPDGLSLVSASYDLTLRLWDAKAGDCISTLEGDFNPVKIMTFSSDGSRLASDSKDYAVTLWDATTCHQIAILSGHSHPVSAIAFSPDGSILASGSQDHKIRLWNANTGHCITILDCYSSTMMTIAFSSVGSRLASGSADGMMMLWDTKTGHHIATLSHHSEAVCAIAFSPDGSKLATGSDHSTVRLWDAKASPYISAVSGHSASVWTMAFSPERTLLASGSMDYTVRLWNAKTGHHIATLDGHSNFVAALGFSSDGLKLASGSYDRTIRIWDTESMHHLTTLEGHSHWITVAVFSPDEAILASGSRDDTVKLWNPVNGHNIATLTGHSAFITAIAFSPDGLRLASGSWDKTVKLWDAKTGHCISTFEGHSSDISTVAFSPDGFTVASGSADLTVRLWNNQNAHTVISVMEDYKKAHILNIQFQQVPSLIQLPTAPMQQSVSNHSSNENSPSPLKFFVRVYWPEASLFGLVYATWTPGSKPVMIPFCWFPPDISVQDFTIHPTEPLISVGCTNGQLLLLDISKVLLP